ncbi:MAG TPA: hypothetical protein VHR17_12810 [Thermoanaerobaculia bacterium]|nr:hypothetical protein [Thermoanaerobaculia bacterium]
MSVIEQSIEQSEAIFLGRAIRVEWVDDAPSREFGPGYLVAVTFEVERQWKGFPGKAITVFTAKDGPACGRRYDVGNTYLVYASTRGTGEKLVTSLCDRGAIVSAQDPRASYEFDQLDQLVLGRGVPDPETAREQEEIRRLYQSYRESVLQLPYDGTVERVVSFLCDDAVDRYAMLRERALNASKEELLAGSLFDAVAVLALRHRVAASTLAAETAEDLLRRYYQAGWEPRSIDLELGKFGELGDEVLVDAVHGRLDDTSSPGPLVLQSFFRFEHRDGRWCLDPRWNPMNDGGASLRYTARALGKPLDQFVLELVPGTLYPMIGTPGEPVEVGVELWEPLAATP